MIKVTYENTESGQKIEVTGKPCWEGGEINFKFDFEPEPPESFVDYWDNKIITGIIHIFS